ncbi:unnamed protein product [Urochloa humidicola]
MAMAYPSRACLILILLTAYLCFMALHATAALSFSYDFSKPGDLDRANLAYMNDSSNSGDRVSLTKATTWSTGRVAYPKPVRLWDDRTGKRTSFTTNFSFAINGVDGANNSTGSSSSSDIYGNNDRGDGMAFLVGPFPTSLPPNSSGGFMPGTTMSASITYDGGSKVMSVSLVRVGDQNPPYSVKVRVDLRDVGVPRDAAVGFSAASGSLIESHQLISWSFSSTDPSRIDLWVIILIAVASASLTGSVAALVCILIHKRAPVEIALPVARKFSYRKLSVATNNFSEDRKLGKGSFGAVYRGDLRDRRFVAPVAVKKFTLLQLGQTRRDYVNEIMILGTTTS